MSAEQSLAHPWMAPQSKEQEIKRRDAQTNMDNFKSYQARRRWKVNKTPSMHLYMHCPLCLCVCVFLVNICGSTNIRSTSNYVVGLPDLTYLIYFLNF